jgi:hypothetical protein
MTCSSEEDHRRFGGTYRLNIFFSTCLSPTSCWSTSWLTLQLNILFKHPVSWIYHLFNIYFPLKCNLLSSRPSSTLHVSAVYGHYPHRESNPRFSCVVNWSMYVDIVGTRGSVVGWGTMLQGGRSRVRFSVRSDFFFKLPNSSNRIMAVWSAQPLIKMSTRVAGA